MLRWSAQETGHHVDLAGIVAPVDPGPPAGRELVALGRAAAGRTADRKPFDAVAAAIGEAAAYDAAAVAANFEIMNRAVDAVGLPVGTHQRAEKADLVELLGLEAFPGARH
jgi:hypothetical protein